MPSLLGKLHKALKGPEERKHVEETAPPLSPNTSTQVLQSITDGLPLHESHAHSNAKMHPDAHVEGGLACNNDALLKEQRDAIQTWIGTMGRRLFSGSFNLINTPFPVIMFEPRSYLEKLADVWVYPRFLQRAAAAADPVERLKLVVTWFVAGLHHGFEKWKKPFNPILGETWQASLSDGSSIFMEQISHHPPVSAFNMYGPGNAYKFIGLSQPTVSIVLKYYGFKTVAKGFRYLEFADGTHIDVQFPGYYVKGVVYSSRPRAEVDGSAVFTDVRNGLRAVVRFGPNKGARAPVLQRSDALIGEVYRISSNGLQDTLLQQPTTYAGEDDSESSRQDLIGAARQARGSFPGNDSEGFETASESEFEMRELRERAEGERGTGSPVLGSRHQRSHSQGRLLADAAAAAGIAAVAGEEGFLDQAELHAISPTLHRLQPPPSTSAPITSMHTSSSEYPMHQAGSLNKAVQPQTAQSAPTLNNSNTFPRTVVNSTLQSSAAPGSGGKQAEGAKQSESSGWGLGKLMGLSAPASAPTSVVDAEPQGEVLSRIEGSWLSHLNFDNCRYWTLATETPDRWVTSDHALPSDCHMRQDLRAVQHKDLKLAQQWKEQLEELQRKDKKLREAGGARMHKQHD